jgi:hypothetical protein
MSTDIRGLMRSLAEDAPAIDNRIALADETFSAGRRRRSLRHLEIGGATAVVVLCALFASLFLGSTPLAAQYGSSSGTRVSGYPSHIGHQFPVLEVPRKPGPAAGLMLATDQSWYLLSPTGHRWSIPSPGSGFLYRPILSDDGRMLGYPDAKGNFVVRDLVSGKSVLFGGFSPNGEPGGNRYAVDYNLPGYFTPDDNNLALPGGVGGGGNGIVVLTIDTHRVSAWTQSSDMGNFMTGWLDNQHLALLDRTTNSWLLDVRDVAGRKLVSIRLRKTNQDQGGFFGWDELTTDHASVDVMTGQTQEHNWVISRYDVRDGQLLKTFTLEQPVQNCSRAETPAGVVTSMWADGRFISVQRTTPDGTTRSVTTVSRSLDPRCVELADAAAAGTSHSPLLLDRLTDFAVGRWEWFAASVGVAAVARRVRRGRRPG